MMSNAETERCSLSTPEDDAALDACDVLCLEPERARALRTASISGIEADLGAAIFRALGDPTRVRIAASLREGGELCVCDLSWIAGASVALVSHHLKSLREAGLVKRRRDGRLMMYRLTPQAVQLLAIALTDERS